MTMTPMETSNQKMQRLPLAEPFLFFFDELRAPLQTEPFVCPLSTAPFRPVQNLMVRGMGSTILSSWLVGLLIYITGYAMKQRNTPVSYFKIFSGARFCPGTVELSPKPCHSQTPTLRSGAACGDGQPPPEMRTLVLASFH